MHLMCCIIYGVLYQNLNYKNMKRQQAENKYVHTQV